MQISKEALSEKNYEGTRLIEITDPKVLQLKQALKDIQEKEANPILDAALPFLKKIDPINEKIGGITKKIQEIVMKIKPLKEAFEEEVAKLPTGTRRFTPRLRQIKLKIEPLMAKVGRYEQEILKLKEKKSPDHKAYMTEIKKVEKLDQKAQLIKNKMTPLINKIVSPQLSEFETAIHILEKNGKIYVEVRDELEEKIKSIRANKAKK